MGTSRTKSKLGLYQWNPLQPCFLVTPLLHPPERLCFGSTAGTEHSPTRCTRRTQPANSSPSTPPPHQTLMHVGPEVFPWGQGAGPRNSWLIPTYRSGLSLRGPSSHLSPIRLAQIPSVGKVMKRKAFSYSLGRNISQYNLFGGQFGNSSQKAECTIRPSSRCWADQRQYV